jgi:hypothetical protein
VELALNLCWHFVASLLFTLFFTNSTPFFDNLRLRPSLPLFDNFARHRVNYPAIFTLALLFACRRKCAMPARRLVIPPYPLSSSRPIAVPCDKRGLFVGPSLAKPSTGRDSLSAGVSGRPTQTGQSKHKRDQPQPYAPHHWT